MPDTTRNRPVGVLLTNLGTPDSTSTRNVRRYLAEFLGDPRVIDLNRFLWLPILYGAILTIRPPKSAAAYRQVWMEEGSPLLVYARKQTDAVRQRLNETLETPVHVALGMRYGSPALSDGLHELQAVGCDRILLLPLYPQYSATTTATTFDKVNSLLADQIEQPALRNVTRYFDDPAYIEALAASVRDYWQNNGRSDQLMMSFHGLPQRYVDNGDPYAEDCKATAHLLADRLDLAPDDWIQCFQSRFGREPWLQPYTDMTLIEWAKQGIKSVDVICPGFSADCVETLEEIAITNRRLFIENGGQQLSYIPALNDNPAHIDMLTSLIKREIGGWL